MRLRVINLTYCKTAALIIAAGAALLLPAAAAAINLDCLADSKGDRLPWKSSWQPDNRDNGVIYEIVETRISGSPEPSEITLLFYANEPAFQSRRTITVKKASLVSDICRAIQGTVAGNGLRDPFKNNPAAVKRPDKTAAAEKNGQPEKPSRFITYVETKGWVRADKPSFGSFTQCAVGGKVFLCLQKEKESSGAQLGDVEIEMKVYDQP